MPGASPVDLDFAILNGTPQVRHFIRSWGYIRSGFGIGEADHVSSRERDELADPRSRREMPCGI